MSCYVKLDLESTELCLVHFKNLIQQFAKPNVKDTEANKKKLEVCKKIHESIEEAIWVFEQTKKFNEPTLKEKVGA